MKRQISESALVSRINRALRKRDIEDGTAVYFNDQYRQMTFLRKTRSRRAQLDLGDYYIRDCSRNLALDTHVHLEDFGRELGVLADYESVVGEA